MAAVIRESIEIAAPSGSVFAALTTPHELLAWWTTAGSPPLDWQMDLRAGGRWSSRWRPEGGGEFSIAGRVLELHPPRLLVVSWTDERYPDAPETRVRYEIVETPHGCRLSLEHSGFTSTEADNYLDYNGGWSRVLGKLRGFAEGQTGFRTNRDVAIGVSDLDGARRFYGDALGFRLCSQTADLLEFDAGHMRLWVNRCDTPHPFVLSLDAPNIARAHAAVIAAGGTVIRGAGSPDGFWFRDPFGLMVDVVKSPAGAPSSG